MEFTRRLQGKHLPEVDLLKEVSYEEINDVIKGLKNSDAAGPDNLKTKTIKKLRPQLHSITIKSFRQRQHARSWKVSKCSPLLKDSEDKDSRFCPLGYRPVGILCSMSKEVEKIIKKWLYAHLENNRQIADTQNGYRRHCGVTTAMIQVAEDILKKTAKRCRFCNRNTDNKYRLQINCQQGRFTNAESQGHLSFYPGVGGARERTHWRLWKIDSSEFLSILFLQEIRQKYSPVSSGFILPPKLQCQVAVHNGKIHIDQALTPSHLFTSMKTGIVILGLTLLTESLVFQISLANICPSILIPFPD